MRGACNLASLYKLRFYLVTLVQPFEVPRRQSAGDLASARVSQPLLSRCDRRRGSERVVVARRLAAGSRYVEQRAPATVCASQPCVRR